MKNSYCYFPDHLASLPYVTNYDVFYPLIYKKAFINVHIISLLSPFPKWFEKIAIISAMS